MTIQTDLPVIHAYMVERTALHSVVCSVEGINRASITYLARLSDETIMAHALKLWRNCKHERRPNLPTFGKPEGAVLTTAHNGHIPFKFWFNKMPNHHFEEVEADPFSRRTR
jgi:hypothetical protein